LQARLLLLLALLALLLLRFFARVQLVLLHPLATLRHAHLRFRVYVFAFSVIYGQALKCLNLIRILARVLALPEVGLLALLALLVQGLALLALVGI